MKVSTASFLFYFILFLQIFDTVGVFFHKIITCGTGMFSMFARLKIFYLFNFLHANMTLWHLEFIMSTSRTELFNYIWTKLI